MARRVRRGARGRLRPAWSRSIVHGQRVHGHLNGEGFEGVDVYFRGRQRGLGRAVREAARVLRVPGVEGGLAHAVHVGDAAEEHLRGREQREPGVLMVVVVPREEGVEPAACVEYARESARVVGLVLEGFEMRLAEGVVVGDVRSTETLACAQRGEKLRERVAFHRGTAVGVHREARLDAVLRDGVREELSS